MSTEPSLKLHWLHVVSGLVGAVVLYTGQGLVSSFRLGGYVQETFVTKTDLLSERAYEKEQHDNLANTLRSDFAKAQADQGADIKVMNQKIDGLHDLILVGQKKGK